MGAAVLAGAVAAPNVPPNAGATEPPYAGAGGPPNTGAGGVPKAGNAAMKRPMAALIPCMELSRLFS